MARARAEYDIFARDRTRAAWESATRGQRRYNRGWREIERSSQRATRGVNRQINSVTVALAAASKRAAGFGAAIASAFAGATGANAVRDLSEIQRISTGFRQSAQDIGRLSRAFASVGLQIDDVAQVFGSLNERIEDARRGQQERAEAFQALGLDPFALRADIQSLGALFDALNQLGTVERTFVGQQLFDEADFIRLTALISEGSAGLEQYARDFDRLAGNIDGASDASRRIRGAFRDVGDAALGVGSVIVEQFEGPILRTLDAVEQRLVDTRTVFEDARNDIDRTTANFARFFTELAGEGVLQAVANDLARAAGELGADILENVTGQKIFNRELETTAERTRDIAREGSRAAQTFDDFRAQRRSLADAGFRVANAERVNAENRIRELGDERLDTELRILDILREQNEARTGIEVSRSLLLPGDIPGARPSPIQAQFERLEEERETRELVRLTKRLVEIAQAQSQESGVILK